MKDFNLKDLSIKTVSKGILQFLSVMIVLIFVLGPVLWLVISSISAPKELLLRPPHFIPRMIDLSHYKNLLFGSGQQASSLTDYTLKAFRYSLLNSLIVSVGVTFLCLLLGSLSGYAAARINSGFGKNLVYIFLIVQMLPVIVLIIPLYILLSRLGLNDRLITIVILLTSIHLPFAIWMLRGFFLGLPQEIEEAAFVDGASRSYVLFRIILPLSLPGLFAAGAYTFMQSWNAFLIPLIFTSSDTTRTVTVSIAMFVGRHYTDYGLMSAAGVLATLPPLIIALIFQKNLMNGLTAGAVKG